jgi:hypothetical protein
LAKTGANFRKSKTTKSEIPKEKVVRLRRRDTLQEIYV